MATDRLLPSERGNRGECTLYNLGWQKFGYREGGRLSPSWYLAQKLGGGVGTDTFCQFLTLQSDTFCPVQESCQCHFSAKSLIYKGFSKSGTPAALI